MNYPIRVLHVVVNMNRGGAETLIMNLYRNIDRTKVQFDFLVHKQKKGDFETEIEALGGKVYRIPYVSEVGHFRYKKELKKFFDNHLEYKIVHAHMDCMSGLVLQASKSAGIPIRISHSHNTENEGNLLVKMYKQYIGKRINPCATDLLACSATAANWLFGKKAIRATTIKNGVDMEKLLYNEETRNSKRAELMIKEDTLVVGHIGRFYPQKNHAFLIDIFTELKKRTPNSLLLLVGDGPLRMDIEKKVKQFNIEDSVIFLGVRSDVDELLQAMDVLLFPSHHEGLPVTVIEAQASSLKCVVSDAVPINADINAGLMTFLNNNQDSVDRWVNEVRMPYKRSGDIRGYLKKSGFDIANSAEKIQNYYLNASTKIEKQN